MPPALGNAAALNALEGELPHGLTSLAALSLFAYSETRLCAPGDAAFQAWLDGIAARGTLETSGLTCGGDPVSVVVPRADGGGLTSPDDRTTYTFSPETFPDGTTVTHEPVAEGGTVVARGAPAGSAPARVGIGHTYELTARDSGGQLVQPARPYSVTIGFSANQASGAVERTLALYFWDGAAWQPEPSSRADPARRVITAAPSHLSRWTVLGQVKPAGRVYLPLLTRSQP